VKIGVIGGGRVGGSLAATWRERGHDVSVSTRDTVAETAADAEVVVLALPAAAAPAALEQITPLGGRILLDATNNLSGGPSGLELVALAPTARYVKAFNTVFSTFMHDTPPGNPPPSHFFCGDDSDAKRVVAGLIEDTGFEPVDVGGSDMTPHVEAIARIVITVAYQRGRGPFVYRLQPS
jgi:predicted dinucleotide-binding enzyme